jgi:hypothetical protein
MRRGGIQRHGQTITDWRDAFLSGRIRCAVCNVTIDDTEARRKKHCASAGHTGQVERYKERKAAVAPQPTYR